MPETGYLAVFLIGLLGGTHCVSMCGGIVGAHAGELIQTWVLAMNTRAPKGATPRVMVVEPVIEKIKFIGTGARIWAGAFAGSSQVLMRVRLRDKETGAVVAEPQFYQRANAWGGAYSAGGTDHDMLSRVTDLVAGYLGTNLETSVGGPTRPDFPSACSGLM